MHFHASNGGNGRPLLQTHDAGSLRIFENYEYHGQNNEQDHADNQTEFTPSGAVTPVTSTDIVRFAIEFSRRTAPFPKIIHRSPPSSRSPVSSMLLPEASAVLLTLLMREGEKPLASWCKAAFSKRPRLVGEGAVSTSF
jgi:hypothetical protein